MYLYVHLIEAAKDTAVVFIALLVPWIKVRFYTCSQIFCLYWFTLYVFPFHLESCTSASWWQWKWNGLESTPGGVLYNTFVHIWFLRGLRNKTGNIKTIQLCISCILNIIGPQFFKISIACYLGPKVSALHFCIHTHTHSLTCTHCKIYA